VVIPLTTKHFAILRRSLVSTGVLRGKRLIKLLGQRQAFAIAVKGAQTRRWWRGWQAPAASGRQIEGHHR
jgi:exodeoxyribonuclease V alpha subunit